MSKSDRWWGKSWNVVTGCYWSQTPEGCRHCWARDMVRRFPHLHADPREPQKSPGFGEVVLHYERLAIPQRRKKPTVYATSLLGDLFHHAVPGEFISDVLAVTELCEQHQFVLITKRYNTAAEYLGKRALWPNKILMASVWDQESTNRAVAALAGLNMQTGLHIEPMLGPVKLPELVISGDEGTSYHRLQWIVAGAENGPGKRPFDPAWALALGDQCKAAGVPFWWKGGPEGQQCAPWGQKEGRKKSNE